MAWHKVVLTTDQIEKQRALESLEKQFEKLYIAADGPSDMALMSENEYTEGKITIYFAPGCSPACAAIISQFGGEECERPSIEEVFLLNGNDDALDLLED